MASTAFLPNPPLISSKSRSFPLRSSCFSNKLQVCKMISWKTQKSIKLDVRVSTNNVKSSSGLSSFWRQIQGAEDWKGLVEPLNPILRNEIVRYGEFVSACYKAFEVDRNSEGYLNCKYEKKKMFREVGMEECGYKITKYIYSTPNIKLPIPSETCGRWIGYVAVSDDEQVKRLGRRDIIVSFRGTVTNQEWVSNFMSSLTSARFDPHNQRPEVKVELGFLNLYTSTDTCSKSNRGSCREQLLSELSRLINKYKDGEISITLAGHSMGSSLALLLAYDIGELGINRCRSNDQVPITVYSFGGPRVGNSSFKERCEDLGIKVLRVVNVNDPVTKLPGVFLNENFTGGFGGRYEFPWSSSCYAHVGMELALDFFQIDDPACVHDLETYLKRLRCPKITIVDDEDEDDILKRARDFLSPQRIEEWQWQVGNFMELLRI